ncbi:MAG: class I SAM-dependent methyltransferase [Burkholderiales bacterium]
MNQPNPRLLPQRIIRAANVLKLATAYAAIAVFAITFNVASAADVPEQIKAMLASPDRSQADRDADARRHPAELLAFAEVRTGMSVLDMGTGGGYTAELLARAVTPKGRVIAQNDPVVFEKFLKSTVPARFATPVMGNVQHVVRPTDDPLPAGAGPLDLVIIAYFYHDTVWLNRDRPKMNKTILDALKPGGMLVIVDHAGNPGTGITQTQSVHRIEESVVRSELAAAGFEFVADAGFLRNPDDPRDTPFFKATIPVDGFVLKFRKP